MSRLRIVLLLLGWSHFPLGSQASQAQIWLRQADPFVRIPALAEGEPRARSIWPDAAVSIQRFLPSGRPADLWFRPQPFRQGWFIEGSSNGGEHRVSVSYTRQITPSPDGTGWRIGLRSLAKPGWRDPFLNVGITPVRSFRWTLERSWRLHRAFVSGFAGLSREAQDGWGLLATQTAWRHGMIVGGQIWQGWDEPVRFGLNHAQLYVETDQAVAGWSVIQRLGFRLGATSLVLGPEFHLATGWALKAGGVTFRPSYRQFRSGLQLAGLELGRLRLALAGGGEWVSGRRVRPYVTLGLAMVD